VIANIGMTRRRFTVEEYHRMAHASILRETDRLELIDGEIIQATSIGRRHAACVARLTGHLTRALADRAIVRSRNPLRLLCDTEAQPDATILRLLAGHDLLHPARAGDVLWLVEVADVSYRYDRYVKLPLYARAGIPEVWLVDLTHEVVEVHGHPSPRGYGSTHTMARGAMLVPRAFEDLTIATADLLPPV
jgi:Uma2 family endonuclease